MGKTVTVAVEKVEEERGTEGENTTKRKRTEKPWPQMTEEEREAFKTAKKVLASRITERKLRMLEENPSSAVVLAPKTVEGHIMVKMLFGFDRVINKLRMSAGSRTRVEDVVKMMGHVNNVISALERVSASLGGNNVPTIYESPEIKRMLAERANSYVFIARSEEGQQTAYHIKRLDPQLVQLRTTCTDFTRVDKAVADISQVIRTMNDVATDIAKQIHVDYFPPKGMGSRI